MKRLGFYSGTFDPVHTGHLALAKAAILEAKLDHVYFLPEARPRDKHHVSDLRHRRHLLELSLDNSKSSILQLNEEQFTIPRSLPEIQLLFPKTRLVFIFGPDVILRWSEHLWPGTERLLEMAELVIGLRNPKELLAVNTALAVLQQKTGIKIRHTVVLKGFVNTSSSRVREALKAGKMPEQLPPATIDYIRAHHLYE